MQPIHARINSDKSELLMKCKAFGFSDLLSHLDAQKSMGWKRIHPRELRKLAEELTKPLCIIYHQSWLTGEDPAGGANVTPIHKKGWKEDPGKYRLSA
ncbi:hypothetical protein DUI87_09567 [Hirundo rustica rustica]|uniref:Uncharacterized protein n=1 Tax=Hirundo rustica rustica TaxID=333673 RepID=A0A3M0KP88_HIRRU|nr:hypothetical protein DUI87_09567 [Hirundo rustica rustica]